MRMALRRRRSKAGRTSDNNSNIDPFSFIVKAMQIKTTEVIFHLPTGVKFFLMILSVLERIPNMGSHTPHY